MYGKTVFDAFKMLRVAENEWMKKEADISKERCNWILFIFFFHWICKIICVKMLHHLPTNYSFSLHSNCSFIPFLLLLLLLLPFVSVPFLLFLLPFKYIALNSIETLDWNREILRLVFFLSHSKLMYRKTQKGRKMIQKKKEEEKNNKKFRYSQHFSDSGKFIWLLCCRLQITKFDYQFTRMHQLLEYTCMYRTEIGECMSQWLNFFGFNDNWRASV